MNKERKITPSFYFWDHLINLCVICTGFVRRWKLCVIVSYFFKLLWTLQAGANMIVSGTAITGSAAPREVINTMRHAVEESIQKANLER